MEAFKSIISIMAYASLGFSVAAAYLKINKIWKRKHHAEVADSQSIAGNVVSLIPLTLFAMNYMFVAQWQGLIDSLIWIIAIIVFILIGSRLWVPDHRNKTFWTRFKEALKLERSEVGDFAASFIRPSSAGLVLEIFGHFAYIDRDLVVREKEFIQAFADNWNLKVDWKELEKLADLESSLRFVKTRDTAVRYLKTSPPSEQVAQLSDLLEALVQVDADLSAQEGLILEEVRGLLLDYSDEFDATANCAVVIVPQNHDQDVAIAALLPQLSKTEVAGGSGYMVGSFYSKNYADMICNQYRALGFFTIDIMHEGPDPA
jgi:hypothetical protein